MCPHCIHTIGFPVLIPITRKSLHPHLRQKNLLKPQLLYLRKHLISNSRNGRGLKLLVVKVEIKTTDTGEVRSGHALIDCGATGKFMDQSYVEKHQLTAWKLQCTIPVFNVDGSLNEAGSITEVVDAILRLDGHSERTAFAVTSLGRQEIILGFTWLAENNLEIDWQTQKVNRASVP